MPTSTKKKKRPAAKKKKTVKKSTKRTLKKVVKKAVKTLRRAQGKKAKKKVIAKAKKKAVVKILRKPTVIGNVTHYYDRIGVAIVDLAMPIRLGDIVRVKHGEQDYLMTVSSMHIDHRPVAVAKKKDVIGLKTAQKIPEGAVILPA